MRELKPSTVILSLLAVVAAGTGFFRVVEGWSWIDSYFFTVVTISTVGYGSLVPATVLGKIGTTVFIFVGLQLIALVWVYRLVPETKDKTLETIEQEFRDAVSA